MPHKHTPRKIKHSPQTHPAEYTQFIRYTTESGPTWKANPVDPFIYVSFSIKQLKAVYENYRKDTYQKFKNLCERKLLINFQENMIQQYKEIIEREWIGRAKLPIEFLSPKEPPENLRNKRILFIFSKPVTGREIFERGGVPAHHTLSFKFESDLNGKDSENKFIKHKMLILIKPDGAMLSRKEIYEFLHETHHAFIEGKHFYQLYDSDVGPFDDLDCVDTVMAYEENCSPVVKAVEQMELGGVNKYDRNPVVQNKTRQVESKYPITLGPVDIAGAEDFKASWNKRNLEALNSELQLQAKKVNSGRAIEHRELYTISSVMRGLIPPHQFMPQFSNFPPPARIAFTPPHQSFNPTPARSSGLSASGFGAMAAGVGALAAAAGFWWHYSSNQLRPKTPQDQLALRGYRVRLFRVHQKFEEQNISFLERTPFFDDKLAYVRGNCEQLKDLIYEYLGSAQVSNSQLSEIANTLARLEEIVMHEFPLCIKRLADIEYKAHMLERQGRKTRISFNQITKQFRLQVQ